jgi:hypothetical protein
MLWLTSGEVGWAVLIYTDFFSERKICGLAIVSFVSFGFRIRYIQNSFA